MATDAKPEPKVEPKEVETTKAAKEITIADMMKASKVIDENQAKKVAKESAEALAKALK